MTLKETTVLVNSENYQDRFKGEYYQLLIRYRRLIHMVAKWDNGNLNFTPSCPRSLYSLQLKAMKDYIAVLEARAVIEGVELNPNIVAL